MIDYDYQTLRLVFVFAVIGILLCLVVRSFKSDGTDDDAI
ncbi:hypothetical protein P245_19685 [Comamonas thiooxydans]|uniref:Uncharacterized protein n=1 Tax=Comamonas thiooxydans TaxID=363952 RepID=A0A0E3BCJ7_9BURK|nr:hypothetical protein P245_19685 [Comamonas thiooxydans]